MAIITLLMLVSLLSGAAVVSSAAVLPTNTSNSSSQTIDSQVDRLDILYSAEEFKEIDHDILQVIGDPSELTLTCESTKDKDAYAKWRSHGLEYKKVDSASEQNGNTNFYNLTLAPPVVRLECYLADNSSVANNTLVYTGVDEPPYLHNHGKTVRATVLNETTARLPCLLSYPIENKGNLELKLFKDGKSVEDLSNDKNNCLSYTPESGYFLNLTQLDNPLGKYECRVENSTEDDFLFVELSTDSYVRIKYDGHLNLFYGGANQKHPFQCWLPNSMFQSKFEWFYLYSDGTYSPITDYSSTNVTNYDPNHYTQTVDILFPSSNITDVVCAGLMKGSGTRYNNSYSVIVKEPMMPNILNQPSDKIISYRQGLNLTCNSESDPISWVWEKNGNVDHKLKTAEFKGNVRSWSSLILDPSADDTESNYTCIAYNYLGNASHSFRVQLPDKGSTFGRDGLIIIGVILASFAILLALFLSYFKVKLTRRRFPEEHIRRFFKGVTSNEPAYNELEPYASVSYDDTREIPYNSLIFERELKGGSFGEVHSGHLVDRHTNSSIPVAIKRIKDNKKATDKELEYAFLSFINEIKIMQYIGSHRNVVRYVGAVTSDLAKYNAYLVVEYCCGGDLASYLDNFKQNGGSFHDDVQGIHHNLQFQTKDRNSVSSYNKKKIVLKTSHLLKWAEEIAAGMAYISSRNLVHMDLAVRNVLLACQGINTDDDANPDPGSLIAKISDFGLSKDLKTNDKDYYQIVFHPDPEYNQPRKLPLRWLSPEALQHLRFTTESDVWAVGVTFWEMFTFGQTPYSGELADNIVDRSALLNHLKDGNILPQPEYAPQQMWEIMTQCWNEKPSDRPDFRTLKEMLNAMNENIVNEDQKNDECEKDYSEVPMSPYATVGFVENLAYNDVGDELQQPDEEEGDDDNNDGDMEFTNIYAYANTKNSSWQDEQQV